MTTLLLIILSINAQASTASTHPANLTRVIAPGKKLELEINCPAVVCRGKHVWKISGKIWFQQVN
jgi:hypothetical protein